MHTIAIEQAARRRPGWAGLRSLYNGVGYLLAVVAAQNAWWSLQASMPLLLGGHAAAFLRAFAMACAWNAATMLPAPLIVAPGINLAPRSGPWRWLWLLGLSTVLWIWCEVLEHVPFGWDWPTVGHVLDGCLTTGLVVGVCAYHNDSRHAADALVRTRIDRASLDAELQRARLRLLRAQIEPHFLFNTLSVVQALARRDRGATVVLLGHLMRCFEATLPRLRGNEVALQAEVELISAYLAIWRVRLGTRLDYAVDVPQELRQMPVPTMMLLTLVENALKHGIGPLVGGGFIRVSASREQGALRLKVADSGHGLGARGNQGTGTGLANISQRLHIMYGRAAALSLQSADPRGVLACITLPAH